MSTLSLVIKGGKIREKQYKSTLHLTGSEDCEIQITLNFVVICVSFYLSLFS
jgi:hypothetical protein